MFHTDYDEVSGTLLRLTTDLVEEICPRAGDDDGGWPLQQPSPFFSWAS